MQKWIKDWEAINTSDTSDTYPSVDALLESYKYSMNQTLDAGVGRRKHKKKETKKQIVLNEDFPRSVIYSVNQLYRYFERLKGERNTEGYRAIDFMIGKIRSKVKYSTVESIMQQGLHAYLNGVKEDLYEVANAFNQHYFAYT